MSDMVHDVIEEAYEEYGFEAAIRAYIQVLDNANDAIKGILRKEGT